MYETRSSCWFLTFILASVINKEVVETEASFLVWVVKDTYLSSGPFSRSSSMLFDVSLFKVCFTYYQNCCCWGQCPPNLYPWPKYRLLYNLPVNCNDCHKSFESSNQKTSCPFLIKWVNFQTTWPCVFFLEAWRIFFSYQAYVFFNNKHLFYKCG